MYVYVSKAARLGRTPSSTKYRMSVSKGGVAFPLHKAASRSSGDYTLPTGCELPCRGKSEEEECLLGPLPYLALAPAPPAAWMHRATHHGACVHVHAVASRAVFTAVGQ